MLLTSHFTAWTGYRLTIHVCLSSTGDPVGVWHHKPLVVWWDRPLDQGDWWGKIKLLLMITGSVISNVLIVLWAIRLRLIDRCFTARMCILCTFVYIHQRIRFSITASWTQTHSIQCHCDFPSSPCSCCCVWYPERMSSLTTAPFLLGYSVTVSFFLPCLRMVCSCVYLSGYVWISVLSECVFVALLKISSHKELQKAQTAHMVERGSVLY